MALKTATELAREKRKTLYHNRLGKSYLTYKGLGAFYSALFYEPLGMSINQLMIMFEMVQWKRGVSERTICNTLPVGEDAVESFFKKMIEDGNVERFRVGGKKYYYVLTKQGKEFLTKQIQTIEKIAVKQVKYAKGRRADIWHKFLTADYDNAGGWDWLPD